ncbi:MAG TPA: SDR family NAD(P)-dependent oxidoreductase [Quisquiliibacterium sp.]|nr:SDR family NAD(P)-dependent oxidoreductase [Quisquiliibacterium sp.]
MKELKGRVAVVTGGASGIGLAMAERFAREGMKLVLADIEAGPLAAAEARLRAAGAEVVSRRTDVMSGAEVDALADAAYAAFGAVHVLCNNAGVAAPALRTRAWECPSGDWDWIMGVNFGGVLNGVRSFVPRMLSGGDEGHVVNTASIAGLLTGSNPYFVSKHAVTCLTEGLYKDFRAIGAKLSASVLCPGIIRTGILDAERNRPTQFGAGTDVSRLAPDVRAQAATFRAALNAGTDPAEVADAVADAVRADRFYVLPAQAPLVDLVRLRMTDIIEQRNPTIPPPA